MRILVVCGAGASSTFVAMRLRHAAQTEGIALQSFAGAEASLSVDLDSADVLLVGPHLRSELPRIRALARDRGVRVISLPDEIFGDSTGKVALDLVLRPDSEPVVTTAPSADTEA